MLIRLPQQKKQVWEPDPKTLPADYRCASRILFSYSCGQWGRKYPCPHDLFILSMKFAAVILILAAALAFPRQARTQPTTGGSGQTGNENQQELGDTLFVFQPARALIDSSGANIIAAPTFGLEILFSNSGFGAGGFYQWNYSPQFAGFIDVGLTGARNADEFESYIFDSAASANSPYNVWRYAVPNKVNRLFAVPVSFGLRYRIGTESFADNFRPYLNIGAGPCAVFALPYDYEFFTSFGHMTAYLTAGGFVGIGAEVGGRNSGLGFNMRYYYIPMHPGIESLKDKPITDFGGLFLTVNIGL